MQPSSYEFLKKLLDTPGPSGFETAAARVWRAEAEGFADRVDVDVSGNSTASLGEGGPRIMLAGHVDEIGVMVTHIDDEGFLYIEGIGGWDPEVLVGQRIRFLTRKGDVVGVVGKKPIHLMKADEKEKAVKVVDLWVDVGARDRADALERGMRVGDAGVVDSSLVELGNGLIASRSADNRIGAYVVLEVLRALAEGERAKAEVHAVATTQEEIGYHGGGARASAFRIDPRVAIAVDLTFSTDAPGIDKKQVGEHKLGSGPVLGRGSAIHALVFERLAEVAEREGIPYTIQAAPRFTSTDADAIYLQRGGVATGVVSIPNRYMHSPNEVVSLDDLDATVRLIAAFCRSVGEDDDFVPR
ncbi:MAG TPA: M42 family metallopeptidase [Longimicrobium sp.]|nr:M42 family metallopeptidase [Longimicrobium sp.]